MLGKSLEGLTCNIYPSPGSFLQFEGELARAFTIVFPFPMYLLGASFGFFWKLSGL